MDGIIAFIADMAGRLSRAVWGAPMALLLMGTGIYYDFTPVIGLTFGS